MSVGRCLRPSRPPSARPDQESGERDRGREHGQTPGVGQAETKQDDVAGHVGREHMAETEIAGGVDQAGGERERQQDRRQGSIGRGRGLGGARSFPDRADFA